ncbi:hypothetical protein [Phytohabitans rumicis]|uniref:Uncharacterized protein n=1 Tax=Phytohabitans rumicis TaxID=1076125 RepID=A0A6V8LK04_9ACTN|nr:hypothetical protein [Phytohabitans rumicis]GFJ95208.1 hypothetical protein Prum_088500 [Phytohabitans rumicis]
MAEASDKSPVGEVEVSLDRTDWRDVSPPVQSIEIEDHDQLTDKATIVLDDHTGALAGAGFEGLFVRLTLGWQAQPAAIFEGEITSARVLAQPEGQKIELTALDFTYRMSRQPYVPTEWAVGERLSEVLKRIATRADYHIAVKRPEDIQPTDDAPLTAQNARRPADGLNEWQFILREADRQGCRTFVEYDGKVSAFYFVPVDRLATAEPEGNLRYCRGIGELIEFDYERISSGATPTLATSTTDPATGASVELPATPPAPPPPLPPPDTDRNVTPRQRSAIEALTELSAAATARLKPPEGKVTGEAADAAGVAVRVRPDPLRRLGQRGRGVAVGNVQLRAKSRVLITGVAPWAEGEWYLAKVNHVYTRERVNNRFRPSYFTKFTATR